MLMAKIRVFNLLTFFRNYLVDFCRVQISIDFLQVLFPPKFTGEPPVPSILKGNNKGHEVHIGMSIYPMA